MLNLFKKHPKGSVVTLKLDGMHCSSCSLNIDGELEELEGVITVKTSYARSVAVVEYDPAVVALAKIHETIEALGYKVIK